MPEKPEKRQAAAEDSKTGRRERLAAELRANLMKRKAQSRRRQKDGGETEHQNGDN